jgi:hypothetical protein
MLRILVCGGRDYANTDELNACLDTFKEKWGEIVLIQGGAKGADWLARMWAKAHNVRCEQYNADWTKHGRAAGPIRNQRMIDEGKPDLVIAFPGGIGTANMVSLANKAEIPVVKVE